MVAQVLVAGAALAAACGRVRCADHRVGDVLQLLQLFLVLLLCLDKILSAQKMLEQTPNTLEPSTPMRCYLHMRRGVTACCDKHDT